MAKLPRHGLLLVVETLLWIVGCLALSAYALQLAVADAVQKSAIEDFRQQVASVDSAMWSESRKEKYSLALEHVGDQRALGVLSIPSIGLEVAIFDGTAPRTLNLGIGRVVTSNNGNLALAGHRDGFFRGLKDVAVGDVVIIESAAMPEVYEVSEIFVVNPEDVFVLGPTDDPSLTLITCYPFYFVGSAPQRYIVRAKRTDNRYP